MMSNSGSGGEGFSGSGVCEGKMLMRSRDADCAALRIRLEL